MLWDNHMHSFFSGDSDSNPLDMIKTAKEKNLAGITFTDHLDLDYKEEPGLFDLDISSYFSKQKEIATSESNKNFTILTGIEVGLQPHVAPKNIEIINSVDFDYVIGSTHVVDGKDPYYESFWASCSDYSIIYRRYYEQILENIIACPYFDSLGHLDYLFRYVPNNQKVDSYLVCPELVDAILSELIKRDIALEINTGAFRKGFLEPNPSIKIIKRYKELGGKLITLGADAHFPEHIAIGFENISPMLAECGYNEFVVYKNRIPNIYPLT